MVLLPLPATRLMLNRGDEGTSTRTLRATCNGRRWT
jgi:hypothetical protein